MSCRMGGGLAMLHALPSGRALSVELRASIVHVPSKHQASRS